MERRAKYGAVKVRPLRQRRADEHSAVRPAGDPDPAFGTHSGADQILGDGMKIVEAALPVPLQRGLMPGRAIFAAALMLART
jgi:hypothetical protein